MGKVAGAALKVVAPEAAVASKVAGGARGKKPGPLRHQPNSLTGLPKDWHQEELDARKADAAWAASERKAGRDPDRSSLSGEPQDDAPADPPPLSPGGGPSLPAMPAAASTGSGFLLGVIAWAGALAYLQGGLPGLKKFAAAKLFNKT